MTLEALAERVEALEAGTSARVVQSFQPAPAPTATPAAPPSIAAVPTEAAPVNEPAVAQSAVAPHAPQTVPDEAAAPAPKMPAGPLDRSAARRAWPAVLAEIRRIKPTRAEMYARIEVDLDTDGRTLVLEFPADQDFAMQMAEDPDMRELLQRALGAVMGAAPPTRFRLARSVPRIQASGPTQADSAPEPIAYPDTESDSQESVPEYFETIAAPHPWAADQTPEPRVEGLDSGAVDASAASDAPSTTGSLTRDLMASLGAEIVAERPAGSAEPGDSANENTQEAELLDSDSSDFGLKDPELFDTDGEDQS
jgi:hypothetical protein